MRKIKKEITKKKPKGQQSTYNIPSYYLEKELGDSSPNHLFCDGDCGGYPNFYHCNK
ncbi:MAG: hypothetical protein WC166_08260 [Bacteroidales bacterium]